MNAVRCLRAAVTVTMLAMAGCMSMEEMLVSKDAYWRNKGEAQAEEFAIDVSGANDTQKKVNIVGMMHDQARLAKVYASSATVPEVKSAVKARLTEEGYATLIAIADGKALEDEARSMIKTDAGRIMAAKNILTVGSKDPLLATRLLGSVKDRKSVGRYLAKYAQEIISDIKYFTKTEEYMIEYRKQSAIDAIAQKIELFGKMSAYARSTPELEALLNDPEIKNWAYSPNLSVARQTLHSKIAAVVYITRKAEAEDSIMGLPDSEKVSILTKTPGDVTVGTGEEAVTVSRDKLIKSIKDPASLQAIREKEIEWVRSEFSSFSPSDWNRKSHEPFFRLADTAAQLGSDEIMAENFVFVIGIIAEMERKHKDDRLWLSSGCSWGDPDKEKADKILEKWKSMCSEEAIVAMGKYIPGLGDGSVDKYILKYLNAIADAATMEKMKEVACAKDAKRAEEEVAKLTSLTPDQILSKVANGGLSNFVLVKLAKEHADRTVRCFAAVNCGGAVFEEFVNSETVAPPEDNLSVGGLFLGMDIVDSIIVFHRIAPRYRIRISDKDFLSYLDPTFTGGATLGKASAQWYVFTFLSEDENESWRSAYRVIWANKSDMKVCRFRLFPDMTASLFKVNGSGDDMARAVFDELGFSPRYDSVRLGIADNSAWQELLSCEIMGGAKITFATASAQLNVELDSMEALGAGVKAMEVFNDSIGEVGTMFFNGTALKRPARAESPAAEAESPAAGIEASDPDAADWEERRRRLHEKWGTRK